MKMKFEGVIAFLPTPFTDDGGLDPDGVERQVDFLAAAGVGSIAVAGGVGEFYSLNGQEHADLVRIAVSAADGRVPVVAGVGHSTELAAHIAGRAASAGAAAIMVNPLYFVRPETRGLVAHYREVGAACGLPLIVFSTAGSVYGPDELEQLAAVPEVAALKDEVGDVELFRRCRARLGDRYAWIDGMAEPAALDYAGAGACAMTSGLVNLDPALSLGIWDAARADDADRFGALLLRAAPVLDLRRRKPGYHTTVLKEGMAMLGRSSGRVRLPLMPLEPDERESLQAMLVSASRR